MPRRRGGWRRRGRGRTGGGEAAWGGEVCREPEEEVVGLWQQGARGEDETEVGGISVQELLRKKRRSEEDEAEGKSCFVERKPRVGRLGRAWAKVAGAK